MALAWARQAEELYFKAGWKNQALGESIQISWIYNVFDNKCAFVQSN
jgi:hypothetical protein